MNYGGGGGLAGGPGGQQQQQYGQPPMGGAGQGMVTMRGGVAGPPGVQQQQGTVSQQQQQQQQHHAQIPMGMQPGVANVQQQRMMVPQQNMRHQMYAQPGMQGQHHGMMPPQGHMQMYPHQGPMSGPMGPNPQELFRMFPMDWQTNISKEANQERKRLMFSQYAQKFVELQRQQRLQLQQAQGRGQLPVYGNNPMMFPGGQQPGVSQQPPPPTSMTPNHMTNANMRVASSQPPSVMSMQAGPNSVNAAPGAPHSQQHQQQHHMPVPSPQIAALSNQTMHAGSPAALNVSAASVPGASPQVGSHHQPSTPLGPPSVQQPNSVGDGSMQQPPSVGQPENTPEYEQLYKELRDKYYEQVKRIVERCQLDNQPLPPGCSKLLEVMDRRRTVTVELLKRVFISTQIMIEKQSLGYDFVAALRKVQAENSDSSNPAPTVIQPIEDHTVLDPWKPLRHLFLRVPSHIMSLCDDSSESSEATRKRRLESGGSDEPAGKQIKLDTAATSASCAVLPGMRRISRRVNSLDEDEVKQLAGDDQANGYRIEIDCTFDSKNKWKMSVSATQELTDLPWRVDPDCLPSTCKSPDVIVCFDSKMLMCPPLRVLVPASYPFDPPVVQFDRSFPLGGPLSAQLATMFERSLSLYTSRSLTCIYDAYRNACQELLKLKGVHNNGHYVPNKHQQKQLVA